MALNNIGLSLQIVKKSFFVYLQPFRGEERPEDTGRVCFIINYLSSKNSIFIETDIFRFCDELAFEFDKGNYN